MASGHAVSSLNTRDGLARERALSPVLMTYLDFDLLIERLEAGYRACVLRSPPGEAAVDFTLSFPEDRVVCDKVWMRLIGKARDSASGCG